MHKLVSAWTPAEHLAARPHHIALLYSSAISGLKTALVLPKIRPEVSEGFIGAAPPLL